MDVRKCCFTGHRPQKLSFGFDESHPDCLRLKNVLKEEILSKIKSGCTGFLTGMAMGADIWCAEIVLECKERYPRGLITLTAVVPYRNQAASFPLAYMRRYASILKRADNTIMIGERYTPGCMQRRNRYMVDHASSLIAVWEGARGGTLDTLRYARKKGLEIILVRPDGARREQAAAQMRF